MSDDLVKRLRDWGKVYPCDHNKPAGTLYFQAADRIEADARRIEGLITAAEARNALLDDQDKRIAELKRDLAEMDELESEAVRKFEGMGERANAETYYRQQAEARVKVLEDALRAIIGLKSTGFSKARAIDKAAEIARAAIE